MSLIPVDNSESKLETAMSYLFGVGVIAATVFVAIGIFLSYHSQGGLDLLQERGAFIHKQNFFRLVSALVRGRNIPTGPLLFVTLGMVSLVLTPLFAVAVSCLHFALTKNFKFVLITIGVLTMLIISLAIH